MNKKNGGRSFKESVNIGKLWGREGMRMWGRGGTSFSKKKNMVEDINYK